MSRQAERGCPPRRRVARVGRRGNSSDKLRGVGGRARDESDGSRYVPIAGVERDRGDVEVRGTSQLRRIDRPRIVNDG